MPTEARPPLLVALVLAAWGCAYVPRVVRLEQPEPVPRPAPPVCIEVAPFSDERVDRTRIGVARNGLYWPTASARTEDDVAEWFATYLRHALAAPGPCSDGFVLKGQVRHVFVDEYFNLDGRLVVTLRLERQQAVVLERDFEGTHRQVSQLGSIEEFEGTLRAALSSLGEQAIPAILAAATRVQGAPGL